MNMSSREFLILGGVASFLSAGLHLVLVLKPHWYHFFGGDELGQLHEQGARWVVLVTFGLALMFAAWGVYALSGAGVIRPLPLLRVSLIAIGVIYILRSLLLPSELVQLFANGASVRFVIFSLGSLAAGLLYLVGTLTRQVS
jgi:hypothetical protein